MYLLYIFHNIYSTKYLVINQQKSLKINILKYFGATNYYNEKFVFFFTFTFGIFYVVLAFVSIPKRPKFEMLSYSLRTSYNTFY